jgi:hypothetical protein
MYNPVFFVGTLFAIHGEWDASVPWYPDSHGCVRIPYDTATFFYELVKIPGTPIYLRAESHRQRGARCRRHVTRSRAGRTSPLSPANSSVIIRQAGQSQIDVGWIRCGGFCRRSLPW